MFTCCPHCNTCFRITKPQLDVAQGHVRCGTCSQVFNAKQHLHEEMPGKSVKKQPANEPQKAAEIKKPHTEKAKPKPVKRPVKQAPQQTVSKTTRPAQATVKAKSKNKSAQQATTPPPDIDLFDYASISHSQDTSRRTDKPEFEEQDIDDIFEDLESQHTLRQPDFNAEKKSTIQPEQNDDIFTDSDFEDLDIDDTALIDISSTEEDWLSDLTSDIEIEEKKDTTEPAAEEITEPVPDEPNILDAPFESKSEETQPPSKPKETSTQDSTASSRYAYVDPSELLKEEKDIVDILQDMDDQLSLEMDIPESEGYDETQDNILDTHFLTSAASKKPEAKVEVETETEIETHHEVTNDESDISGMFRHAIEEANVNNTPSAKHKKDDFESTFLASLDSSTLSPVEDKPKKPAPSVKKPIKPVSTPAAKKATQTENTDKFEMNPPSGFPELPGMEDEVPYQLRDNFSEDTSARSIQVWSLYIAASVILVITVLLQLVIFRSTDLADRFPSLESTLSQFCNTLPCRYSGPQDISQIKLLSRDIRLHPKDEKALLISATMVNRAKFKQPYPNIEVTLSDLSGDVVARRQFTAEEYLNRIYTPLLRMPAGQPVKIALEVIDPGRDAVNFEFVFR